MYEKRRLVPISYVGRLLSRGALLPDGRKQGLRPCFSLLLNCERGADMGELGKVVFLNGEEVEPYVLKDVEGAVIVEFVNNSYRIDHVEADITTVPNLGTIIPRKESP